MTVTSQSELAMHETSRRFNRRGCPICGADEASPIFLQRFEQLSTASPMNGYEVVICAGCGAGYAEHIPTQVEFDAYYRDLSKYEIAAVAGERQPVEPRFREMAEQIKPFISSSDARILEIGSASGGLLAALQDLGFNNLVGADPSPACVKAARAFYGIPGFAATLFTVPVPAITYDFLILTGVMEHIVDLDRAVSQFRQLLRPGGKVYLEVPDASRYEASQDAPYQEFSVEHINFFSTTSLANLMRNRGFRALETGLTMRSLHEVGCPCAYGVFEYTDVTEPLVYDADTERGLRQYIRGCQVEDERITAAIREARAPGEKLLVWGTGTHTLRLLASGGLDPTHIAAFVDSNPNYQGQQLRGLPVLAPEDLRRRPEPILISSRNRQREILGQIVDGLRLNNRVILLYEHAN